MANSKKLPVTKPLITSWQWHATLFSILSNDENAKKWIFSNYIQFRCYNITEIFTGDDMLLADIMPGSSSRTTGSRRGMCCASAIRIPTSCWG